MLSLGVSREDERRSERVVRWVREDGALKGNWRKNKTTGGHWCNACYKKNRLDRMNDDPNVVCWKCDAMTSWGPEWRRNGNAYVCMKCTQLEHQRKLLAKTKRKRTADATPKTASRHDDE